MQRQINGSLQLDGVAAVAVLCVGEGVAVVAEVCVARVRRVTVEGWERISDIL